MYQTDCLDLAYAVCATPVTSGFFSTQQTDVPVTQQTDEPDTQQPNMHTTQQPDVPASCPEGHNWKVYRDDCFWVINAFSLAIVYIVVNTTNEKLKVIFCSENKASEFVLLQKVSTQCYC